MKRYGLVRCYETPEGTVDVRQIGEYSSVVAAQFALTLAALRHPKEVEVQSWDRGKNGERLVIVDRRTGQRED